MLPDKQEFIELIKTKNIKEIAIIYDRCTVTIYAWIKMLSVKRIYKAYRKKINVIKLNELNQEDNLTKDK